MLKPSIMRGDWGGNSLMRNWIQALVCAGLSFSFAVVSAQDVGVTDAIDAQTNYQQDAAESQSRIDQLDDETVALLSEYHTELERLADLETYNANMREMRASQEAEKQRLTRELAEVEVVRREIVPLMVEMVDVLAQFIELDQPVLREERVARLDALQSNLNRSDVELGEKYRRLIEAYQIEAEYGQTIEAYEGPLSVSGRDLTVDYLRIGRVALFYLSLDRGEGGLWDPVGQRWAPLQPEQLEQLEFAVRVARKQAPPNLMQLPLWTGAAS